RSEQHLRIILAAHLRQDVCGRLDGIGARGLRLGDDLGGQRMLRPLSGESEDFRQSPTVARLGDDPQALGQEQAFRAPRLLVAQRTQALHGRIGKSGDLANHYSSPKRSSTIAASLLSASSASTPVTWMMIVSPIAAPSIIRPMIEVPQTRLPSFSTTTSPSIWLARLTNLALARAWRP